ncbi:MAG: glycosyltransferase [Caldilineales bacterium]|nr:glycosyltransferase [Caldilineales bacterium]
MKFSVITVCYNAESFIENTIQSVLVQDYPDIEYIVIDGDSTDKTKQIIEKYRNNIHIYVSEKDEGIYDAMNKAVALSTGEYLLFLHAGDLFISPDILTRIYKFIVNKKLALYYGDAIIDYNSEYQIYRHADIISGYELYYGRFVQQAVFYHRNNFMTQAVGLFDCHYRIRADQEWHLRFFRQYRGSYQHIPLLICRYEGVSGFSRRQQAAADAERRALQRRYRGLFSGPELGRIYLKRLIVKVQYRAAALLRR